MCSRIIELRQQVKESIMIDRSFLNIEAIKESIEDALLEVKILISNKASSIFSFIAAIFKKLLSSIILSLSCCLNSTILLHI